ncbi:hypothetical protein [Vibrio owensii]|uniref:hypothetical protein n=1 Tax=Vibrio owensii TaxID=696485 RepID=UPI0038CE886F
MSNTEISIPISDEHIEKAAKQVFQERVKVYANELTCPVHGTLPDTEFVDGKATLKTCCWEQAKLVNKAFAIEAVCQRG